MAQKVESRLAQIIQYLHFLKHLSLIKVAKAQDQGPKYAPGHRASSFVVDYFMKTMHVDWDDIDERERTECRRRYLRKNRQARRWILVASKLTFGILLVPSKLLESKVNDAHITESYLISMMDTIAIEWPRVAQDLHHLDQAVRSVLNSCEAMSMVDVDLAVAEVDNVLCNQPQLKPRNQTPVYSPKSPCSHMSPVSDAETFVNLSPIFPDDEDMFPSPDDDEPITD
ncbi:hypothetical protein BO94DRAFT_581172 [Aspergillus sclerotioniger CBS 115572]|uniref:Uncharacterized protein n=1 Tax=Aspergillus sclerotioniger CBS 115572 TaxID=1450535 RepID=A0A317XBW4_9EURO|nr:hypothetical protein BO94DRAFT_581172 [Aspergillus sclerotioniger CBS 115572]PWY96033.1 hypothetical protein BO94DRAFT_581172 [Aspergillus sclerotioniger CBS 115572]